MKIGETVPNDIYNMIQEHAARVCVDGVIIDSGGKVLLTRRAIEPYNKLWHFPGGGIRKGESFKLAINRILENELGISPTEISCKVLGAMEFLEDGILADGSYKHSVSIALQLNIPDDLINIIKLNHEASEFGFFEKAPEEMHPIHQKFAEDYNILKLSSS
jgi:ADP-ribose pyrophosphatase YjhB (NUDIX family)